MTRDLRIEAGEEMAKPESSADPFGWVHGMLRGCLWAIWGITLVAGILTMFAPKAGSMAGPTLFLGFVLATVGLACSREA